MEKNQGAPLIAAALIIGIALIATGLMIKDSLDVTATELAGVREAIEAAPAVAPQRQPPRQAARRPGRPDPARRYEIDTEGSPSWGPENASITVVEFSDFQCPFCSRVWPTLQRLRDEYPNDVRIVFKHMPLEIHPKAEAAHVASQAAHEQGKFWEMHNEIFANQRAIDPTNLASYAEKIGLDKARFEKDIQAAEVRKAIEDDKAEAAKLGVSGTPAFFINGKYLSGAQPYESFKRVIDQELEG